MHVTSPVISYSALGGLAARPRPRRQWAAQLVRSGRFFPPCAATWPRGRIDPARTPASDETVLIYPPLSIHISDSIHTFHVEEYETVIISAQKICVGYTATLQDMEVSYITMPMPSTIINKYFFRRYKLINCHIGLAFKVTIVSRYGD